MTGAGRHPSWQGQTRRHPPRAPLRRGVQIPAPPARGASPPWAPPSSLPGCGACAGNSRRRFPARRNGNPSCTGENWCGIPSPRESPERERPSRRRPPWGFPWQHKPHPASSSSIWSGTFLRKAALFSPHDTWGGRETAWPSLRERKLRPSRKPSAHAPDAPASEAPGPAAPASGPLHSRQVHTYPLPHQFSCAGTMGRKAFPGKLRRETKPSQAAVIRPRPQQEKQPCRTDSGMSPRLFLHGKPNRGGGLPHSLFGRCRRQNRTFP